MIRRSAAILFAVTALLAVWTIAGAHSAPFGAAPVHADSYYIEFDANGGSGTQYVI